MCKYCEGSYYNNDPTKHRKLIAEFSSEEGGTIGSIARSSYAGCEWTIFIDEDNNKLSFICGDLLPDLGFDVDEGEAVEYQGWALINYCPMCGRKL